MWLLIHVGIKVYLYKQNGSKAFRNGKNEHVSAVVLIMCSTRELNPDYLTSSDLINGCPVCQITLRRTNCLCAWRRSIVNISSLSHALREVKNILELWCFLLTICWKHAAWTNLNRRVCESITTNTSFQLALWNTVCYIAIKKTTYDAFVLRTLLFVMQCYFR